MLREFENLRNEVELVRGSVYNLYTSGTWTPTWTNLTVVGGPPTYAGKWWRIGNLVHARIKITPNGGTTASTATSTYCNNLPFAAVEDEVALETSSGLSNDGPGFVVGGTTNLYTPTWAASSANRTINAWFEIA